MSANLSRWPWANNLRGSSRAIAAGRPGMANEYQEYEDYDGSDSDGFDDEDDEFDCGAMRDMNHKLVGCSMAGTEDCDFDCPYRETVERSLRAQAGHAKRKAGAS